MLNAPRLPADSCAVGFLSLLSQPPQRSRHPSRHSQDPHRLGRQGRLPTTMESPHCAPVMSSTIQALSLPTASSCQSDNKAAETRESAGQGQARGPGFLSLGRSEAAQGQEALLMWWTRGGWWGAVPGGPGAVRVCECGDEERLPQFSPGQLPSEGTHRPAGRLLDVPESQPAPGPSSEASPNHCVGLRK